MPDNHGRSSRPNNGLHSDCISYAPSSHGGYAAGLGTLRASGGDIGGGSEILIIENRGGVGLLMRRWDKPTSTTIVPTPSQQETTNNHRR